ncbi:N-acetyl-beta-D-glucosaminidase [Clostridia bacterium]|nr:N-acetyl-beta-D-glucosaminidase [Clostridia bacterium]
MKNGFDKIGVMIDCSRNAVPNVKTLKLFIDNLAKMGYNRLELYTEDTYEIKNRPYFGYLRGRYSGTELKEIDAYASGRGIELTPCIQVLAHLNQIFRWPAFAGLRDCNDILLVDEPETYKLIEDMFASVAENFTSRNINIGCDEAFMVGLGKFFDRFGYQNRFEIINRHIGRVLKIAEKYGFKCAMWSDMYFRLAFGGEYADTAKSIPPEVLERIPQNISLIYWDYYSTDNEHYRKMFAGHKKIGNEIEFAGGAWKWQGFAPDNLYSINTAKAAVPAAREYGIKKIMVAAWGDNGAETSLFAVLPTLFYFARLCRGKSVEPAELEKGFRKIAGTGFEEFMDIELVKGRSRRAYERNGSAEKALLYCDYFCGVFDTWVTDKAEYYKTVAQKLKIGKYGKFSYIFKTMRLLAEILELKTDIGVRTRALYRAGDKAGLKELVGEYIIIAKRIETFYKEFQSQWMRENKPHGFEVQDLRIGGLIRRTRSCHDRLLQYCAGRLDAVSELDEDILHYTPDNTEDPLVHNSHTVTVSVNVI